MRVASPLLLASLAVMVMTSNIRLVDDPIEVEDIDTGDEILVDSGKDLVSGSARVVKASDEVAASAAQYAFQRLNEDMKKDCPSKGKFESMKIVFAEEQPTDLVEFFFELSFARKGEREVYHLHVLHQSKWWRDAHHMVDGEEHHWAIQYSTMRPSNPCAYEPLVDTYTDVERLGRLDLSWHAGHFSPHRGHTHTSFRNTRLGAIVTDIESVPEEHRQVVVGTDIRSPPADFVPFYNKYLQERRLPRFGDGETAQWATFTGDPKYGGWDRNTFFFNVFRENFAPQGMQFGTAWDEYWYYKRREPSTKNQYPRKRDVRCKSWGAVDQKQCASCYAHAAMTALATQICYLNFGKRIGDYNWAKPSARFAADCATIPGSGEAAGCKGGTAQWVYDFSMKHDVVEDGCTPDTGKDGSCAIANQDPIACSGKEVRYKVKTWKRLHFTANATSDDRVRAIQDAIHKYGSVYASFRMYDDFPKYKGGVYTVSKGAKFVGNHAVTLVGWRNGPRVFVPNDRPTFTGSWTAPQNTTYFVEPINDTLAWQRSEGFKYPPSWLIQNSWSSAWGFRGFASIAMGTDEAGIESTDISYPIADQEHLTSLVPSPQNINREKSRVLLGFNREGGVVCTPPFHSSSRPTSSCGHWDRNRCNSEGTYTGFGYEYMAGCGCAYGWTGWLCDKTVPVDPAGVKLYWAKYREFRQYGWRKFKAGHVGQVRSAARNRMIDAWTPLGQPRRCYKRNGYSRTIKVRDWSYFHCSRRGAYPHFFGERNLYKRGRGKTVFDDAWAQPEVGTMSNLTFTWGNTAFTESFGLPRMCYISTQLCGKNNGTVKQFPCTSAPCPAGNLTWTSDELKLVSPDLSDIPPEFKTSSDRINSWNWYGLAYVRGTVVCEVDLGLNEFGLHRGYARSPFGLGLNLYFPRVPVEHEKTYKRPKCLDDREELLEKSRQQAMDKAHNGTKYENEFPPAGPKSENHPCFSHCSSVGWDTLGAGGDQCKCTAIGGWGNPGNETQVSGHWFSAMSGSSGEEFPVDTCQCSCYKKCSQCAGFCGCATRHNVTSGHWFSAMSGHWFSAMSGCSKDDENAKRCAATSGFSNPSVSGHWFSAMSGHWFSAMSGANQDDSESGDSELSDEELEMVTTACNVSEDSLVCPPCSDIDGWATNDKSAWWHAEQAGHWFSAMSGHWFSAMSGSDKDGNPKESDSALYEADALKLKMCNATTPSPSSDEPEEDPPVYNLKTVHTAKTGYVNLALGDQDPVKLYVDNDWDDGGWVLIGRGRDDWQWNDAGRGSWQSLADDLGLPAAFSPAYAPSSVVNSLLTEVGATLQSASSAQVRLKLANRDNGATYREIYWEAFNYPKWSWKFDDTSRRVRNQFQSPPHPSTGGDREAAIPEAGCQMHIDGSRDAHKVTGDAVGSTLFQCNAESNYARVGAAVSLTPKYNRFLSSGGHFGRVRVGTENGFTAIIVARGQYDHAGNSALLLGEGLELWKNGRTSYLLNDRLNVDAMFENYHTTVVRVDPAKDLVDIWLDGQLLASYSGAPSLGETTVLDILNKNGGSVLVGELAELYLYNRALDDSDMPTVAWAMAHKWANVLKAQMSNQPTRDNWCHRYNDDNRLFLFPFNKLGYRDGFGQGKKIETGQASATNYLYNPDTTFFHLPYTEVYIRVKPLLRQAQAELLQDSPGGAASEMDIDEDEFPASSAYLEDLQRRIESDRTSEI